VLCSKNKLGLFLSQEGKRVLERRAPYGKFPKSNVGRGFRLHIGSLLFLLQTEEKKRRGQQEHPP
jgi:hypothetical protein